METLKEKTAKGLFWGGMNNGVQQLLGLAFGIILGRLLDPSDYGMTAMLAVFSVIANELQSSGFKTGLINLKSPTHDDYNAVFWFNVLAGAAIYVVLWFCAPLIADYYHQPKLIPLSRYVFLGFVFSSFGMAQSAYLTKHGLRLLGPRHAVSAVYRHEHPAAMVLQPLAPNDENDL